MSYYKGPNPDWIASPVGIAPRPFIAGGLREWPVRKYNLGPTTNYRMPALSGGCGACGGFGEDESGAAGEFWAGQWAGGAGAGVAAGAAAGALQASAAIEKEEDEPGFFDHVFDSGSGDGTEDDASYDAYTTDVEGTGAGTGTGTTPAPGTGPTPAPAKGSSLLVPVLLGLGLLGLVLWTKPKARRNPCHRNSPPRGRRAWAGGRLIRPRRRRRRRR